MLSTSQQLASLSAAGPSDAITDVLGAASVFAFFAIACYVALQVLKDSSRKRVVSTTVSVAPKEPEPTRSKEISPKKEEDEKTMLERHCEEVFNEVVEGARKRLEDFAQIADETYSQIADGYASHSFGLEGENHSVRTKKFRSVCERQWISLRSEIGYVAYMDIQEHLRHILVNHRLLDGFNHAKDETSQLSPDLLRSQELVALMRVVPKDKIRALQSSLLKAVGNFRDYFDAECKVWINEQVVKLSGELCQRRSRKIQVTDTEYYKVFKQLKTRLEVIARLADSVTENTQQVNEPGLALSQVIHVGAVFGILSSLPSWFEELGLGSLEAARET